jgi:hypothetical protein
MRDEKEGELGLDVLNLCSSSLLRVGACVSCASKPVEEHSPFFFFSPLLESNTARILFFPWRLTMIEGDLIEQ